MVAGIELYTTRLRQRGVRVQTHPAKTSLDAYLTSPPEGAQRILLDEAGDAPDSLAFADMVRAWGLSSEDVHLMVGPPDGWGKEGTGVGRLSLSTLTMPPKLRTQQQKQ